MAKTVLFFTVLLLTLSFVSPVFAPPGGGGGGGGAHLWFYSVDPDTLAGPQPLPDPQVYDPNWVGASADGWITESVVTGLSTSFNIWLGCKQFNSTGTTLVVSINDAAFAAIDSITVYGSTIGSWSSAMPSQLSPHGVFNAADFHGYAEVGLIDLYSPPGSPYKVEIPVEITFKATADLTGAKIHFDAYGYTESGALMKNPYSHDLTVPEPATIFMALTSLGALGVYAYKRKKIQ